MRVIALLSHLAVPSDFWPFPPLPQLRCVPHSSGAFLYPQPQQSSIRPAPGTAPSGLASVRAVHTPKPSVPALWMARGRIANRHLTPVNRTRGGGSCNIATGREECRGASTTDAAHRWGCSGAINFSFLAPIPSRIRHLAAIVASVALAITRFGLGKSTPHNSSSAFCALVVSPTRKGISSRLFQVLHESFGSCSLVVVSDNCRRSLAKSHRDRGEQRASCRHAFQVQDCRGRAELRHGQILQARCRDIWTAPHAVPVQKRKGFHHERSRSKTLFLFFRLPPGDGDKPIALVNSKHSNSTIRWRHQIGHISPQQLRPTNEVDKAMDFSI